MLDDFLWDIQCEEYWEEEDLAAADELMGCDE